MHAGAPVDGAPSADRRRLLKRAVYLAAAGGIAVGAGAAAWSLFNKPAPSPPPGGKLESRGLRWITSSATSAWANDKEGQPMRASDFPHTQLGGPGVLDDGVTKFIVCYLDEAFIDPSMKDLVAYGASGKFAAYRSTCTHLVCTTLWRTEEEAHTLVTADVGHDLIVCPCHTAAFDPYDSGKVRFAPAPTPLAQVPLVIDGDLIKVRLPTS